MKSYTHLSPTVRILLYSLYHVCIPSFYPSILPSIGCDTLKNKLQKSVRLIPNTLAWFSLTIVLFFFFLVASVAYGSSLTWDWTGAIAATYDTAMAMAAGIEPLQRQCQMLIQLLHGGNSRVLLLMVFLLITFLYFTLPSWVSNIL